jgi:hypothetical protein
MGLSSISLQLVGSGTLNKNGPHYSSREEGSTAAVVTSMSIYTRSAFTAHFSQCKWPRFYFLFSRFDDNLQIGDGAVGGPEVKVL